MLFTAAACMVVLLTAQRLNMGMDIHPYMAVVWVLMRMLQ